MSTQNDDTRTQQLNVSRLEERLVFFLVFTGVLALTYGFFFVIDFLPEKPISKERSFETTSSIESEVRVTNRVTNNDSDESGVSETDVSDEDSGTPLTNSAIDPYPNRIIFDTLDKEIPILNPESRSIEALDTALLSGAVRHPDSADFIVEGTIFLFGHSSYLPKVINQNFQAFNGIQKLKWGDTIRLQSSDTEYVYRVNRVYETSAVGSEIAIETGEPKLTLVTCDSFGSKSDRFVVEATLMKKESLVRGEVDNT